MRIPLTNGSFMKVRADVVEEDTPLFLGKELMKRNKLLRDFDKGTVKRGEQWKLHMIMKRGYEFVQWKTGNIRSTRAAFLFTLFHH